MFLPRNIRTDGSEDKFVPVDDENLLPGATRPTAHAESVIPAMVTTNLVKCISPYHIKAGLLYSVRYRL